MAMFRVGDRVKVVRISGYLSGLIEGQNRLGHVSVSPVGKVGVVTEVVYNHNMHRTEVTVRSEGSLWVFEPWNLMKTYLQ